MDNRTKLFILYSLFTLCQLCIASEHFYCQAHVKHAPCNETVDRLNEIINQKNADIETFKKLPDRCELVEQKYTNLQIELQQVEGLPPNIVQLLDTFTVDNSKLSTSILSGFKTQTNQLVTNLTLLVQRLGDQTQLNNKIQKCESTVTDLQKNIRELLSAKLQVKPNSDAELIKNQTNKLSKLQLEHRQMKQQLEHQATYVAKLEAQLNDYKNQIQKLNMKPNFDAQLLEDLQTQVEGYAGTCEVQSCQTFGKKSGVLSINKAGSVPSEVFCNGEVAGLGWTVIQRRIDGSVSFNRNWNEYQQGFGDLTGNYFMGLEQIHRITNLKPHQLYILLEDFENNTRFAKYDGFAIGTAAEKYVLKTLDAFSGTAGDDLDMNKGQKFSTFDQDNDSESHVHCANKFNSGWWFNECGLSNLNGEYHIADEEYAADGAGIIWSSWLDTDYSLKSTLMMIRPKVNLAN